MKSFLVFAVLFLFSTIPVNTLAQEDLHLYHVVDVEQGGNASVMAGVEADSEMELSVAVTLGCCQVGVPETVKVWPGRENLFVIKIHASLKQEPGYYNLVVTVGNASRTMGVSVGTSDLVQRLPGLTKYADSLHSMVEGYGAEGMRMEEVEIMLDAVRDRLAKARRAVEKDDVKGLRESLFFVEKRLYYEIPLRTNSIKSVTSLYNLIWIPVVVLVVGLALILLRMRS